MLPSSAADLEHQRRLVRHQGRQGGLRVGDHRRGVWMLGAPEQVAACMPQHPEMRFIAAQLQRAHLNVHGQAFEAKLGLEH